tara:strand:+ start:59 stop:727 length:669 start_codon:yes stop_codon:yes gene_type:complete
MAKYFRHFPKTFYTPDVDSDGLDTITNLIARFKMSDSLVDNTNVFYPYDVQDTDTPEIIADKMYGNSEKHWIVLSLNKIVDPQWDWPMRQENFVSYLNKKYETEGTANNTTGVTWALDESNIQAYYKTVTRTISAGASSRVSRSNSEIKEKLEIDASTYANVAISSDNYVLKDGSKVTEKVTKSTESYYTYEFNLNEAKRSIKILQPQFAIELDKSFKKVFR